MKLAAISVDLDEIPNYYAIHGLSPPPAVEALVYDLAVPRLVDEAALGGYPLTLFAVGADLARAASGEALARAVGAGHEIANHSLDHRYDLTRLPRAEIVRQIDLGAAAIEGAVGRRPRGFRAPGYTITDQVFDVLAELEVGYDSSVFPCPSYWAAKAAAVGMIRARGRVSHSVVDTPRVLTAPIRPYRVGRPYHARGGGLLELPIQVTPTLRLPVIGTSLTLGGPFVARRLVGACVSEPLVNLELHGIDLLDAADGLEALSPHQPDVRVPLARKRASLRSAVDVLRRAGYTFVTLEEAAEALRAAA
ncbi:MAG: polysaccharide deacetylase family protein [Myxococcales bacterium]|nr:polysaccharide deacetylase family protein [Myxococcales bacterium]